MDAFKNNSEEFYKDILKGKADVSDFERYVYGNSSQKTRDDRDELEAKEKADKLKLQRELRRS